MGFLDNYEASRERNERWWRTYPDGRIETRIVEFSAQHGYVLVEAKAYRTSEDLVPAGIDYAYGYQNAYTQNMKRWFVEDTTTSAIMRVMQLVLGGAERSTRETMEQVEKLETKTANQDIDYWNTKFGEIPSYGTAAEAEQSGVPSFGSSMEVIVKNMAEQSQSTKPQCRHGERVWRTGVSAKTKKEWAYYGCTGKKPDQCDPIWYVITSDGTWKQQF